MSPFITCSVPCVRGAWEEGNKWGVWGEFVVRRVGVLSNTTPHMGVSALKHSVSQYGTGTHNTCNSIFINTL